MSNQKEQIGIITEQGFVAGQGLGFNPVNLNENKNKTSEKENEKQSV